MNRWVMLLLVVSVVLTACMNQDDQQPDLEGLEKTPEPVTRYEAIEVGTDIPPVSEKAKKAWERYKETGFTDDVRNDLESAYREGDLAAGHNLANELQGTGKKVDRAVSIEIFHELSERGLSISQTQLGIIYLRSKDDTERCQAKSLFEDAAADGMVIAETYLGHIYKYGVCVDEDKQKAESYFLSAASKGDGLAKANLAESYFNSSERDNKLDEIVTLLEESTAKGNMIGQTLLGQVLTVTDTDRKRGEALLVEAAKTGIVDAAVFYSKIYAKGGIGDEFREEQLNALQMLEKFEDLGSPDVLYQLGLHYTYGYGVDRDREKAADYFHHALKSGSWDAGFMLGMFRLHGEGVSKSECKAAGYFAFVAKRGHERAKQELEKIDIDEVCD